VISILVLSPFQSSEFFKDPIYLSTSLSIMKSGSLLLIFGVSTRVIGVSSRTPDLTRYLKKDFNDDILRFIVLAVISLSLIEASQLRT
jgi:hypothetical protein